MNKFIPILIVMMCCFFSFNCKNDSNPIQPVVTEGISLNFTNWHCFTEPGVLLNPASGVYESVTEGLKIYGHSYRGNERLVPVPTLHYPIMDKTIYVKWKANGGGGFMGVGFTLYTDSASWGLPFGIMNLTTDHSYNGSIVITNDTWYYTRIVLTTSSCIVNTATGNFDNSGGTVIETQSSSINNTYAVFSFGLWDAYNSTSAYLVLAEAKIESLVPQEIPLELANWKCFTTVPVFQYISPAAGTYEKVSDGLKIYGNGYRGNETIFPVPTSQYPITNRTIYLKWRANGGGNFIGVGANAYPDTVSWLYQGRFMNLTTNHSYDSSVVITEDVWYYTRVVVTSSLVTATSSTGNYDNNGGTVVQTLSRSLTQPVTLFTFGLWDTYAGTTPYAILGEARIE